MQGQRDDQSIAKTVQVLWDRGKAKQNTQDARDWAWHPIYLN